MALRPGFVIDFDEKSPELRRPRPKVPRKPDVVDFGKTPEILDKRVGIGKEDWQAEADQRLALAAAADDAAMDADEKEE